jgi:hypothetical protein
MRRAHGLGLRTYGMLCPLMPGIADSPDQVDELVAFVKESGAEEVLAEAVNPRGPGRGTRPSRCDKPDSRRKPRRCL